LKKLVLSDRYFDDKKKKWTGRTNEGEKNKLDHISKNFQQLSLLEYLYIGGAGDDDRWDIQKIENLPQNIHMLNINSNQISKIENLPQNIHTLDIYNNQISKIENLPQNIHSLDFGNNQISKIENLPQDIHTLHIGSNRISKIENLPQSIHKLIISNNQISKIENLPNDIQTLYISSNQISKIENLPNDIHTLYINSNQISNIENLPQNIHNLDIRSNQISNIENLPNDIQRLDISSNQISKIENLPQNIHNLDIRSNQISKIENLPNDIQRLYIRSNQISKIENLPNDIQTLDISSNQISKIENLPQNIHTLGISHNQIKDLKPLLPFIEKRIKYNISKNPIENPPMDIVKQGDKAILNYFKQLEEEEGKQEYLFEAKLLVIGEAGAGKTTFARRIQNPQAPMPKKSESTHGINIDKWDFPLPAEAMEVLTEAATFFVNLWDFGGQEIYHATHQFFFSQKSLYVLLADTREQKTDFSYWLNTVEQLAGDDSLLFILLNRREDHNWNIDELGYRSRFGEIMTGVETIDLSVSADIPALQEKICERLKRLDGIGQPLIKSWVDIRESLAEETANAISLARFREICALHGRTDEQDIVNISRYFHRIGVFTHYVDDAALQDKIYLNSNHLVKTVYQFLEHELVEARKGRLTQADIDTVWKTQPLEKGKMLVLLEKYGLMYQASADEYIIPVHLKSEQPYAAWQHETESPMLHFRYQFDKYMPKGLLSRLIVALHKYIPDHSLVWHRGVNLSHNGASAEIIEQYGGTNQFDIRIVGDFQRDLLVIITSQFDKILSDFKKLALDKSIQCPCTECAETKDAYFHKTKDIEKALIKNKLSVECKNSTDDIRIRKLLMLMDYENVLSNLKEKARDSVLLREMREMKSMLNEQGEKSMLQHEYILEHVQENNALLKMIKAQTNRAEVQEMIQALLAEQSENDVEDIIKFLNVAVQTQDVQNMEEFGAIQKAIANLNKSSTGLEGKIKIGLPLAALTGIDMSIEGKLNLKKVMKKIIQKTEELAVKHNINY